MDIKTKSLMFGDQNFSFIYYNAAAYFISNSSFNQFFTNAKKLEQIIYFVIKTDNF